MDVAKVKRSYKYRAIWMESCTNDLFIQHDSEAIGTMKPWKLWKQRNYKNMDMIYVDDRIVKERK
ncbi:hypothetical protein M514_07220 [Trichuris suis]|uniref:Uncharacterized protein n=1 Tax=Trichuris suis TaxID=68888 RepID=A0A085NC43_9BILA|nr:hypothetical protein M513_07220 [Trichuris suis]KFD67039.1 hypothetical protein M514_07220 [Trichuris suis]